MSRLRLAVLIILSAGCAAVLASWAALKFQREGAQAHGHAIGQEADFHQWVHAQLDLTARQEKALVPFEDAFDEESAILARALKDAGHDLAHAMQDHSRDSPEIAAALLRVNQLQLELQKLTLNHFFDMKDHLEPAQARKLFEWTHDSISEPH